jgi:endoglucanase
MNKYISAKELVSSITAGWNLGNSYDAHPGLETSWGNPEPCLEQIQAVKSAGFNAIRIPVSWSYPNRNSMSPDWKICSKWMTRIRQIVQHAIDECFVVILNTHHELNIYSKIVDNIDAATRCVRNLWKQIAAEFRDFSEKLIFEGLNEPRIIGHSQEWDGGTPEEWVGIKKLSQAFIDTVRETGGNNKYRSLMFTVHAAHVKALRSCSKPIDSIPDRLILSIHPYLPYSFSFCKFRRSLWDASGQEDIDYWFNAISDCAKRFNIPVIVGEWGSEDKDNIVARVAHAEYYTKAAKNKGFATFWWDNGYHRFQEDDEFYRKRDELFAIFDRQQFQFSESGQMIAEAIMKGVQCD